MSVPITGTRWDDRRYSKKPKDRGHVLSVPITVIELKMLPGDGESIEDIRS